MRTRACVGVRGWMHVRGRTPEQLYSNAKSSRLVFFFVKQNSRVWECSILTNYPLSIRSNIFTCALLSIYCCRKLSQAEIAWPMWTNPRSKIWSRVRPVRAWDSAAQPCCPIALQLKDRFVTRGSICCKKTLENCGEVDDTEYTCLQQLFLRWTIQANAETSRFFL